MLSYGTTTAEAKSGYSLDVDGEIRLLRLLNEVHSTHAIDLEITFLGAHVVPPEFEGRDDDYVTLVCEEMIPAAADLAAWCDVFCDKGAFTPVQSRRVLEAGKANGLAPRIHANELDHSGGASVAANVGAASADHLLYLRPGEAKALAVAGCCGVICPTTAMSLGRFPNVALMREVGLRIVIASDLNPGMDPYGNLQFGAAIAIRMMGFGPEDALLAITAGGAAALRRDDIGRVAPGCLGDLVVLGSDSVLDLGYQAGANLAWLVIKHGAPVHLAPTAHP
jgi:imidazolonepropionase